jgi:dephospho-CoA kinase
MTRKEIIKNRINHYINAIIRLQKQNDTYKKLNVDWVDNDKNIEYCKNKIMQEIDKLLKEE